MAGFKQQSGNSKPSPKKSQKSLSILNQAIQLHLQGDIEAAEDLYRRAARLENKSLTLFTNLGVICNQTGRHEEALSLYKKALAISPKNENIMINISNVYLAIGKPSIALEYSLKAFKIHSINPNILLSLGNAYRELGDFDKALYFTLESFKIATNNPLTLGSLGDIYALSNNQEKAIEFYTKSADLFEETLDSHCLTSLISLCTILVEMGRIEDSRKIQVKTAVLVINNLNKLNNYNDKRRKVDASFMTYLEHLIPKVPKSKKQINNEVLHIGESHCLSFTNQIVNIKNTQVKVKPCLIKGVKAFHLSEQAKSNKFKTAMQLRIKEGFKDYKSVFISIGEIDCRKDEGIIRFCKKYGKQIETVAQETASNYFDWMVANFIGYTEKLVFFGTPAPIEQKSPDTESNKSNLLATQYFNQTLKEKCSIKNILFADVYRLTAGKNGFNNNKWMLDGVHLDPISITELLNSYLS